MKSKRPSSKPASAPEAGCPHHWIIPRTEAAVVEATCKLCGGTRYMANRLGVATQQRGGKTVGELAPTDDPELLKLDREMRAQGT